MIKYFTYESSLTGPVARIWHGKQTDGNGKDKETLTPLIALLENDVRTLDELVAAFPYEACLSLKS